MAEERTVVQFVIYLRKNYKVTIEIQDIYDFIFSASVLNILNACDFQT
jgi:hypothetical protein